MLETKEVEVKLSHRNIKHYIEKGYLITSDCVNTILKVKVTDLSVASSAVVKVVCDGCGKVYEEMTWRDYMRSAREDGEYYCQKCAKNGYKKYISFEQWCYDNLSKELTDYILSRWDYELNIDKYGNKLNPKDVSIGSNGINKKGYWFKCLCHPEHKSEQHIINNSLSKSEYQRNINCRQCNKIAITHPHLVKYFVNKEDAYKYSRASMANILMKCPDCGHEKKMIIHDLRQGFGCPRCSDGVSFPNKFMFSMLDQIQDFEAEYSPDWIKPKRYDFYFKLNNIEYIVEMDGKFHKEDNNLSGQTKEESKTIDDYKDKMALEHNIMVIRIDSSKSDLKYIKDNIFISELAKIFDLSNIDWLNCYKWACSSYVKIACDYWNSGFKNTLEIANILKVDRNTITRYLKQGAELKWCNYDSKEEAYKNGIRFRDRDKRKDRRRLKRSINDERLTICLTNGEILTITNASKNIILKLKIY